jgi:biotin transport system substrate-specific component
MSNESFNADMNYDGGYEEKRTKTEMKKQETAFSVKTIVFVGVFAAMISVCALISIQTPWGVPFTLHTFAIALTAYCLGKKKGTLATLVWVLIGLIGVPVYSNFTAGPAKLFGATGGYIWSFIFMTFLCGMGLGKQKKWLTILFSLLGLLVCYVCGMIQFMFVMHMGFAESCVFTH